MSKVVLVVAAALLGVCASSQAMPYPHSFRASGGCDWNVSQPADNAGQSFGQFKADRPLTSWNLVKLALAEATSADLHSHYGALRHWGWLLAGLTIEYSTDGQTYQPLEGKLPAVTDSPLYLRLETANGQSWDISILPTGWNNGSGSDGAGTEPPPTTPVPEPLTMTMLTIGGVALAIRRRKN